MESILKMIVGAVGGVFFINLILKSFREYKGYADAQRTEMATRKRQSPDTIPQVFPCLGYDSSGHRMPTKFEALVESDRVDIQKIEHQADREKELVLLRKKRRKKTCRHPYH
jgi:hypothetical protein